MIAKKILLTLLTAAVMALSTTGARAQSDERAAPHEEAAGQQTAHSGGLLDILARQKKAIAGSWLATVTIPGGPPPFKALFTFTEDGNVVSPAQGGVQPSAVFTPAHGAWTHLGGRSFVFTMISLVYSPTTGSLTGLFKVRGTVTLDSAGNEWSGPQNNELSNPAGNVVFSGNTTAQAQRIKVEPLP